MNDDSTRRWAWRNCREILVSVWLYPLPWQWRILRVVHSDFVAFYGCIQLGPVALRVAADIGNSSAEGWRSRFALSEAEAWERTPP
jgi:hypothetical protein